MNSFPDGIGRKCEASVGNSGKGLKRRAMKQLAISEQPEVARGKAEDKEVRARVSKHCDPKDIYIIQYYCFNVFFL